MLSSARALVRAASKPRLHPHDDRRCRRARRRRSAVAAAVRRAAAAFALRPHSVVHPQVPVLRFQFARSEGRRARRRRTSTRSSPISNSRCRRSGAGGSHRCSSAAARRACSRQRRSIGCWRRFARACRSRPTPKSRSKPIPGTFEREKFTRVPRGGRQPAVARHPELQSGASARARPRARRATRRARAAEAALAIFGNVNLDLMYALPRQTLDAGAGRRRRRARVRAAASVVLSAHARAQYAVPSPPAAAARRRCRRGHRGRRPRRRWRQPAIGITKRRRMRAPGSECAAQPQLLAVRRLPRHRRGRAFQALVSGPHRARRYATSSRGSIWSARRPATPLLEERRVDARRHRLRVHAERAAPHRRRPGVALRRAHRLSARAWSRARWRRGGDAG